MDTIIFNKRKLVGKKSKKLLLENIVPAVVYNSKGDSTNIQISRSDSTKILKNATSTTILDAKFGTKKLKVLVKEVNINPFTSKIRHIAFFEIDENKDMVFTIPFKIVGVSPAVKNNLGVLIEVLSAIDVRCKLSTLVPFIEVDVTNLEHPGQSISMNEINIPKGMELLNEDLANETIVTITELQEEEILEPEVSEDEEAEAEDIEGEQIEGEAAEEDKEAETKEEPTEE
ncbi:MAG: 50S ribosomal protein L25 [Candidatus Dojkabacteria bacterium]|jgi:large subunit ribosomal protein L25